MLELDTVTTAKQLGVKSRFIVGDACHMPFKENLFNYCFSYSVLQHFSREDVLKTLKEDQKGPRRIQKGP